MRRWKLEHSCASDLKDGRMKGKASVVEDVAICSRKEGRRCGVPGLRHSTSAVFIVSGHLSNAAHSLAELAYRNPKRLVNFRTLPTAERLW